MVAIAFIIVDRANLRALPLLHKLHAHPEVELHVVCTGSSVLPRFGDVASQLEADGYRVHRFHCELEGDTPHVKAKSASQAGYGAADVLERIKPVAVVCIGDRYELLPCVFAAHLMRIPICHLQGGEVSTTRDQETRFAVSMLATWHVPATERAMKVLTEATQHGRSRILTVGCPSSDAAATVQPEGGNYILSLFHPNTDRGPESAAEEFGELLMALAEVNYPVLFINPNIDAGGEVLRKVLIRWQQHHSECLSVRQHFEPQQFLSLLAGCRCAVGNSSSFARDSSFFGTPAVLVGDRQNGRETAENVVRVPCERGLIIGAIREQIAHGRYKPSSLYGDGKVSERIVTGLLREVKR